MDHPEEWRWLSYRFYAFGEPMEIPIIAVGGGKRVVELIDENPFYKDFGKNSEECQRNYRDFSLEIDNGKAREKFNFRDKGILSEETFKKQLRERGIKVEPGKKGRPPKQ